MNLLLTSSGLRNQSQFQAIEELLNHPIRGTKFAYIPTAANIEPGNKDWMIEDMHRVVQAGCEVDVVDISALEQSEWLPRLETAAVIMMGGGNTPYLMHWVIESGLEKKLPELLETRV